MIAVDTNVLVHAHRQDSLHHAVSKKSVEQLAQGVEAWVIPWPCVHEFYGVVTHQNRFKPASTIQEAIDQLEQWAASPSLQFKGESPQHLRSLLDLSKQSSITGAMIHDARIAAICLQHGVRELWTFDRDFSRFPQLKCRNILVMR